MDRRSFLKYKLTGLLWLSAGAPLLGSGGQALAQGAPDIAVCKGSPAAATRGALELLGGMGKFVKTGQKVVIKPNMSFARAPEEASNTHPEVIRELVVLCKEAGAAKISVLDNPLQNAQKCLELSGIKAAVDGVETGVCRMVQDADFYLESDISGAAEMNKNSFMKEVLEADVIIAAPVAKSHGSAGVSLSLKGQMGLIMDRWVMHSRYDLAASIVDLNMKIRPHLAVIDATRVLSTNGPGGPGKVLTPGEVIASADPVAADSLAVASYEWYGQKIAPRQVAHLALAHERGLGRMDVESLDVKRVAL